MAIAEERPHADDTAQAQPPAGTGAPAWESVVEEVGCPLCGYNLRGLAEPRCPECGYRFEWEPLLDPTKRLHPYLFEHHPERNAWSFVRTMLGGLLPRRFWRSLQPAQPSRVGRLVLYWVLATALAFAGTVFDAARSFYEARQDNEGTRQIMLVQAKRQLTMPAPYGPAMVAEVRRAGGVQAWVDKFHPPTFSRRFVGDWYRRYDSRGALRAPLVYALWPWLSLATLMIFAASMRRAKVRKVHVMRCALYCCDAGIWLVPLAMFLAEGRWARGAVQENLYALVAFHETLLIVPTLFAAYTTYRLAAAYRFYLRFDHPVATALAAQLIVLLLVVSVWLNLPRV